MTDPSVLIDALVTAMQAVSALVAEVNGDPFRIIAYHERFPGTVNLGLALYQLEPPAIMVVWEGSGPNPRARGRELWADTLGIYIRAREETGTDTPAGYYQVWTQFVAGLLNSDIHADWYPMDPPRIQRQTLFVADNVAIDYHKISVSFAQRGI